ncbi:MAG: hypothetical protein Q7V17_03960, partial [Afipia sp.]|nr:hypothetical protein [Afipia sp.]
MMLRRDGFRRCRGQSPNQIAGKRRSFAFEQFTQQIPNGDAGGNAERVIPTAAETIVARLLGSHV